MSSAKARPYVWATKVYRRTDGRTDEDLRMNTHNVLRDVERPKFRQSSRFLLLFLFTAAVYILRSSRRETIFSLKSRRPRLFYFFFSLSFLYLSSSFSFVGRRKKLFVFKTQSASPSKFSFSEQMARGASGNLPKGLVFLPFFFFYFLFLLFLIYTHFIFSGRNDRAMMTRSTVIPDGFIRAHRLTVWRKGDGQSSQKLVILLSQSA